MIVRRNLVRYHQSIAEELQSVKNRARDIIGNSHWGEDGAHKETILRKVLQTHIPESFSVSKGFVCYPNGESSTQIDILITDRSKPTLFKEGEFVIVTPDSVKAIIEVKTTQKHCKTQSTKKGQYFQLTASKIARDIEKIRLNAKQKCWAGVFIFDHESLDDKPPKISESKVHKQHQAILQRVQEASEGLPDKAINCIAFGRNTFIRYWQAGSKMRDEYNDKNDKLLEPPYYPAWHSYYFQEEPEIGLAQAYFVSNLVSHLSKTSLDTQYAWFPLKGGKETHRRMRLPLKGEAGEPD